MLSLTICLDRQANNTLPVISILCNMISSFKKNYYCHFLHYIIVSQMDNDKFVPIATVARFNQVRLFVDVLLEPLVVLCTPSCSVSNMCKVLIR